MTSTLKAHKSSIVFPLLLVYPTTEWHFRSWSLPSATFWPANRPTKSAIWDDLSWVRIVRTILPSLTDWLAPGVSFDSYIWRRANGEIEISSLQLYNFYRIFEYMGACQAVGTYASPKLFYFPRQDAGVNNSKLDTEGSGSKKLPHCLPAPAFPPRESVQKPKVVNLFLHHCKTRSWFST